MTVPQGTVGSVPAGPSFGSQGTGAGSKPEMTWRPSSIRGLVSEILYVPVRGDEIAIFLDCSTPIISGTPVHTETQDGRVFRCHQLPAVSSPSTLRGFSTCQYAFLSEPCCGTSNDAQPGQM